MEDLKKNIEDDGKFTVVASDGTEVECEVLFTFDSDETGKHYIVYTDNTTDEDGNINTYASTYELVPGKDDIHNLEPVESEEEWKLIETILKTAENEVEKEA